MEYYTLPDDGDQDQPLITVDGIRVPPREMATRVVEYYGRPFLLEHRVVVHGRGTMVVSLGVEILPLTSDSAGSGARFSWDCLPP